MQNVIQFSLHYPVCIMFVSSNHWHQNREENTFKFVLERQVWGYQSWRYVISTLFLRNWLVNTRLSDDEITYAVWRLSRILNDHKQSFVWFEVSCSLYPSLLHINHENCRKMTQLWALLRRLWPTYKTVLNPFMINLGDENTWKNI